ncbi:MAG: hypothetical protein H6741_06435 [Alphaproteobacteria bacterium]|nr:hypothetical protein [Alphaproteobacteria bacterium]MCB9792348.1 hypothetical protein [Alphaproteobacteria bacterium]
MIDAASWTELKGSHPALGTLDEKTADIARDELDPGEAISVAEAVTVDGKPGVVLMSKRRVLAFWKTTMLVFFKLPTVQEFNLSQLTEVQLEGSSLRLRAVADPKDEDAGWEDNTFVFASAEAAERFRSYVQASRGTMAD